LSAITADIGTITAGNLQSQDYDATNGMIIDLDNRDIEIKKNGVDKLVYDGDTGNLSINGDITVTGGSGIANLSDAGDLATKDTVGKTDCDTTLISGGYIATNLVNANSIEANSITASKVGANEIITNTANVRTAKIVTLHLDNNTVSNDVTYSNTVDTSINSWTYAVYQEIFHIDYVINSTQPEYILIFNGHVGADINQSIDCNYVNYTVGLVFRWQVWNLYDTTAAPVILYTFNDNIGLNAKVQYTCNAGTYTHAHAVAVAQDSGGNFLYSQGSGFSPGDTIRCYCLGARVKGGGATSAACTGDITVKQLQITGLKR